MPPKEKPVLYRRCSEADAILMISKLVDRYPEYVRDISDFRFEKAIGKGGFGEVWLANDLRTGKMCAVKELQTQRINAQGVTSFIREVQSMISLRAHRFILPFVGFTVEQPYSLITEYAPNGSLNFYVHSHLQKQSLSGTHLTIDAMSIAYAMVQMHKLGLAHRDLKSSNILVDSNYLPMIADFGTARLVVVRKKMTPYTGTLTHMAPEVFFSKPANREAANRTTVQPAREPGGPKVPLRFTGPIDGYGLSCDVYSYGMMLYEMSQGHIPFGISRENIIQCIQNNEKPRISSKTPKPLADLILACINHNPSKRPFFIDIYNMFKNGEVYFPNSVHKDVLHFAEQIERLGHRKIPPPSINPSIDIPSIKQRMKRQYQKLKTAEDAQLLGVTPKSEREKSPKQSSSPEKKKLLLDNISQPIKISDMQQQNDTFRVLSDTSNAQFVPTLRTYVQSHFNEVKEDSENDDELMAIAEQFSTFYHVVSHHFTVSTSPFHISAIIDSFTEISRWHSVSLEILAKYRFFAILPVNPEKVVLDSLYNLIWQFFVQKPELIDNSLFRTLGLLLIRSPFKSLELFKIYVTKYDEVDDPFKIFDFFMSYASVYVDKDFGSQFVDIFFYLLQNFKEFRVMRLRRLMNIFTAMSSSHNRFVALSATKAFSNFYTPSLSLPGNDTTDSTSESQEHHRLPHSSSHQSLNHQIDNTNDSNSGSISEMPPKPPGLPRHDSSSVSLFVSPRREASFANLQLPSDSKDKARNQSSLLALQGEKRVPRDTSLPMLKLLAQGKGKSSNGSSEIESVLNEGDIENDHGEIKTAVNSIIVNVPYKTIIRNMMFTQTAKPAISILKRVDHYPASNTLFRLLLKHIPYSTGVLMKFVNENDDNAKIAAMNSKWMSLPADISLRIFMLIYLHTPALEILLQDSSKINLASRFFTSVLATLISNEQFVAASSLLKRLPLDQAFIDSLTEAGFFKNYAFMLSKCLTNVEIVTTETSFLEKVAQIGYSSHYIYFIPSLGKLLSLKNAATTGAIAVIVRLSNYKDSALAFVKMNFVPYFQQLLQTKYSQFARQFLANIEKFTAETENNDNNQETNTSS